MKLRRLIAWITGRPLILYKTITSATVRRGHLLKQNGNMMLIAYPYSFSSIKTVFCNQDGSVKDEQFDSWMPLNAMAEHYYKASR